MGFHQPTKSGKVTCKFGTKGARWQAGYHTGTDYAGNAGDPVFAIAGGKVLHANRMGGWGLSYGIHIVIESEGTPEGTIQTLYAHLSHVNLKVIGTGKVAAGDIIGFIGATGTNASGPHLHLEVRKAPYLYANKVLDPEKVIKPAPAKKPAKKP